MPETATPTDYQQLARQIKQWGAELGFQQIAITDTDLKQTGERLNQWLSKGYQGDMRWMGEHGSKRYNPPELLPGTTRVITVRLDYLPNDDNLIAVLKNESSAYISRYALGRDYHKLIRKRLTTLAKEIEKAVPGEAVVQRPFVDSAPVMEKPLAVKAGLGWMGKHTLVINSNAGSWFFLGEIYTNLPLPVDEPVEHDQCGECSACLKVCPTDAFPEPYVLDARRCISYLTIEHKGSIPEEFREPMGNRVFGCDDCQAICPWNKEAAPASEKDFSPRHKLDNSELLKLFRWSESEFLKYTEGSPIRRIGYERWLRNLAIGLGNAPTSDAIIQALQTQENHSSELVREHVGWALGQHQQPGRKRKRKIKA
ncbi:MAG: tRNA epoxyqueuosine(34) reductase QueG [Porticoccaceae bacterium]|nr:tRNA epoxyqueuosine(34) reductase QueG [Pseudomonadales bacterium]MCP5171010.1 tRNA epoxyqueuosine(34) reductase QueG [Pseudomonadales bacterium]MCP5301752.1 tRNA epoxyqueuosine(34) reductase QueG [Pseudomonadales bacterium]